MKGIQRPDPANLEPKWLLEMSHGVDQKTKIYAPLRFDANGETERHAALAPAPRRSYVCLTYFINSILIAADPKK